MVHLPVNFVPFNPPSRLSLRQSNRTWNVLSGLEQKLLLRTRSG
ncbi:hypothetical protein JMJ77_0014725, partial [Colletotrichum scovillei]